MKITTETYKKILSRNEIPSQFQWDIESLYNHKEDWEIDCQKVEQLREELIKYKERFTRDTNSFLRCLQLRDEISELIQKIYTFAHMRKDEENHNDAYQSIFYRASGLLV